mmetsp:Transcript_11585/g.21984  ORF Transcript_11585/g.21984 Transcript_11585/m.21984 type:complete len:94 (-) Transcript_11585:26-307(-)
MPISFEAAVVVGQPAGEGTLAGLCMSGGQVLGIGLTLLLGVLLEHGSPKAAWLLSGSLFILALLAVSLFRPKGNSVRLPDVSDLEESLSSSAS